MRTFAKNHLKIYFDFYNKMIFRINPQPKSISQIVIGVVLFCVVLSGIALSLDFSVENEDLVYCPLQKKWVKETVEPVRYENPLDEICAANTEKNSFLQSFTVKFAFLSKISTKIETQNLFFSYVEKGEKAFVELTSSHHFPDEEFLVFGTFQKGSVVYKNEFVKKQNSVLEETVLPRPPNFIAENTKFEFPATQKLEQISHQIFARPPPAKLS